MKTKRLLMGSVVLLIGVTLLSAPAAAKSMVQLKIWTHQRHMADTLQELIGEFNRTVGRQKEIQLSLRLLGDDSSDVFQEAQYHGTGPDLYNSGFSTGYGDPFKAGAQIWYDDFPGFAAWKAQWPDWYWIEGVTTYRGHVFTIPTQVLNSRLIYNKDLFRAIGRDPNKPPRSYAELREIAAKITRIGKGRVYGFAYCGADNWPLEWMPSQWAEANGDAAYWDWSRGRWAMQGYGRVLQLLLDLQRDGFLFPGVTRLTNDALRAQFAEGRIGMFMGEFWDVGVLNDQFPAKNDWGVAPIPTYDGKFHGKPRAMIIGGLWSINGQCRHKLDAWEVVKWFSRYETRAKLVEQGKCIDPDPKVNAGYVKNSPAMNGYNAFAYTLFLDYLGTYPNLPGWQPPEENPFTVFRRIVLDRSDPADALHKLDALWNRKLDTYYRNNPKMKRDWNIYPDFDRVRGLLGQPKLKPKF